MHWLNRVSRVFDYALNIFFFIGGVVLVCIMLVVCAEIAMRYFLGIVHVWEVQICGDSLVWIAFLPAGLVLKENRHVRVDLVVNIVSPRIRHVLNLITTALGLVTCLTLTYYSAHVTWDHFAKAIYEYNILVIPKGPLLSIIPLSSLLLSVEFLREFLSSWKPKRA